MLPDTSQVPARLGSLFRQSPQLKSHHFVTLAKDRCAVLVDFMTGTTKKAEREFTHAQMRIPLIGFFVCICPYSYCRSFSFRLQCCACFGQRNMFSSVCSITHLFVISFFLTFSFSSFVVSFQLWHSSSQPLLFSMSSSVRFSIFLEERLIFTNLIHNLIYPSVPLVCAVLCSPEQDLQHCCRPHH